MDSLLKILLVEDDPDDAVLVGRSLARATGARFDVTHVSTLGEAVALLKKDSFDAILLDLFLPDSQGLDALSLARTVAGRAAIVVVTGVENEAWGVEAVRKGAEDFLVKGRTDAESLIRAATYAVERRRAQLAMAEARDLAEKRAAEAEWGRMLLRAVMDNIPEGITIAEGPDVRVRMVSRYGLEMIGRRPEALEGTTAGEHPETWDLYRADGVTRPASEELPLTRAVKKGEVVVNEEWIARRPDGRMVPILCNAGPIRDANGNITGGLIAWRDITEVKRVQQERDRLIDEITHTAAELEERVEERTLDLGRVIDVLEAEVEARRRAQEEFRRANRALTMVSECNQAVSRADDEAVLLKEVCRTVVETGGYKMAWVGYVDDGPDRRIRPAAQVGFEEGYLESTPLTLNDDSGYSPTPTAIRKGEVVVRPDYLKDDDKAWREFAVARGFASSISLPLGNVQRVSGALTIFSAEREAFGKAEVELLKDMADNFAFGIMALRVRAEKTRTAQALHDSNELLERMFLNIHMLVAYMDAAFNFIRVNRPYAEADGRRPEDFPGRSHFALYPNAENEEIFRNVVRTGTPYFAHEKPFVYRSNPERGTTYWDWSLQPVKDTAGSVTGLVLSLLDVTGRVRGRQALEASEARYRSLMDEASDAIILTTPDGDILDVNARACQVAGYTRDEMLHLKAHDLFPADEAAREPLHRKRVLAGKTVMSERTLRRRDGSTAVIEASTKMVSGGVVQSICRDITARKAAEEKIRAYQRQLRQLASELSRAEQETKRQIAKDLHDYVGQTLALCQMKLGSLREAAGDEKLARTLAEVREHVAAVIKYTRSLTTELGCPVLYELGLEAALEWLVEKTQQDSQLICAFEDDRLPKPLDEDVKVALFTAARESVVNIVKHAKARIAKLSVRREQAKVCVTIQDDGVGFEPSEAISRVYRTHGFGLFSIRERLDFLGGAVEIDSAPGRGTTVTLRAPLKLALPA